MIRSLTLRAVGPSRHIGVQFGPRLNIITGDNGLGKTVFLDACWWSLAGTWPAEPLLPKEGLGSTDATISTELDVDEETFRVDLRYDPHRQTWPTGGEKSFLPALCIYARVDGSFAVWDPVRKGKRRSSYLFSSSQVWDGLKSGNRVVCRGLIDDVGTWQARSPDVFGQFSRVLDDLAPDGTRLRISPEPGRISLDDVRDIPMLEAEYGLVPITHASAGVKRIVQLGYLLVWATNENRRAAESIGTMPARHVLLLIDEAEAHLHPRWQQRILPALYGVVGELHVAARTQIIATTHSPLVLASVDPLFDDELDRLFTFEAANGSGPQLVEQDWAPRSDPQSWLASEAFDELTGRPGAAEHAVDDFERAYEEGQAEAAREAYRSLARIVASDDGELIRLRAILRQQGWFERARPSA